jgi:hypothetical protein
MRDVLNLKDVLSVHLSQFQRSHRAISQTDVCKPQACGLEARARGTRKTRPSTGRREGRDA